MSTLVQDFIINFSKWYLLDWEGILIGKPVKMAFLNKRASVLRPHPSQDYYCIWPFRYHMHSMATRLDNDKELEKVINLFSDNFSVHSIHSQLPSPSHLCPPFLLLFHNSSLTVVSIPFMFWPSEMKQSSLCDSGFDAIYRSLMS